SLHRLPSFPTRRSSDLSLSSRVKSPFLVILKRFTDSMSTFLNRDTMYSLMISSMGTYTKVSARSTSKKRGILDGTCTNDSFLLRSEEHTSELQSRENLV